MEDVIKATDESVGLWKEETPVNQVKKKGLEKGIFFLLCFSFTKYLILGNTIFHFSSQKFLTT